MCQTTALAWNSMHYLTPILTQLYQKLLIRIRLKCLKLHFWPKNQANSLIKSTNLFALIYTDLKNDPFGMINPKKIPILTWNLSGINICNQQMTCTLEVYFMNYLVNITNYIIYLIYSSLCLNLNLNSKLQSFQHMLNIHLQN